MEYDVIVFNKFVSLILLLLIIFVTAPSTYAAGNKNPFDGIIAANFDEKKSSNPNIGTKGGILSGIYPNDWVMYKNVDFNDIVEGFEIECGVSGQYAGKNIELRLDKPDGPLVGNVITKDTGTWETLATNTGNMKFAPTGVHDLYLVSAPGQANFGMIVFKKKPKAVISRPLPLNTYDFKDIKDTAIIEAVGVLCGLKLLKGYSDDVFRPQSEISRAEFATIVASMLGLKNTVGNNQFADVPAEHWASGSILAVHSMGIIKGYPNGNFGPNDPITYNQIIKILITTLGYDEIADSKGGYPEGYLVLASEKGLLKGVNTSGLDMNGIANRGTASLLVYNSLNANVMHQTSYGNNGKYKEVMKVGILGVNSNTFKSSGVVAANGITSLTSPDTNLTLQEVEIDGIKYRDVNGYATGYLGHYVMYYYEEDSKTGERTLLYARLDKKNEKQVLNYKQNLRFDGYKLIYNRDEYRTQEQSLNISPATKVIYNGKALEEINYETLLDIHNKGVQNNLKIPFSGEITWVDYNDDGIGDVLFVESPTVYLLKNFSIFEKKLIDNYGSPSIDIDLYSENQHIIIENEGKKIGYSNLQSGTVLTIYQGLNTVGKSIVRIEYSDKTVQGIVKEIEDEKVVIGDEKYELTPEYVKAANANINGVKKIYLGSEGTFKLDSLGRIAAFEPNSESGSIKRGILINYGTSEKGLSKAMQFKIFSQDGAMLIKESAEKTTVDGSLVKNYDDLKNLFTTGLKYSLIRYGVDSNGQINYIDTKTENKRNNDDVVNHIADVSGARYRRSARAISNMYPLSSNPLIFRGPGINSLDVDDEKAYSVIKIGDLTEGLMYSFAAYNMNKESGLVDTLVIDYPYNLNLIANIFMIEKISDVIDGEGNITKKLSGLYNGNPKTFIINSRYNINPSYQSGTLVKPLLDAQDRIISIQVLFNPDASNVPAATIHKLNTQTGTDPNSDITLRLIYGKALNIEDGILKLGQGEDGNGVVEYFNIGATPIFIFDEDNGRFNKVTNNDIITGITEGSKMFLRVDTGIPRIVIIYK